MPAYPPWEVLKKALRRAKSEEKGVQVVLSSKTVCAITKIQSWEELYGQFAVYESDEKAIIFYASDILFVDISGADLVLHLKVGKMPEVG